MLWEHVQKPGGRSQGRDQRGTNPLGGRCGSGSEAPGQLVVEREGLTLFYFPEKNKIFEPVSYAMELSRAHETTAHLGNGSHGSVCSVTV